MSALPRMTTADFDFELEKKAVDTVLVAFTDNQGRLVGRRLATDYYTGQVLGQGVRVPSYLLATDASGHIVPGFPVSSVDTGYRDLVLHPDLTSLFRMPWEERTVGVLGDLRFEDGTSVTMSPRAILRRQTQRAQDASLTLMLGLEPQFTLTSNDGHLLGAAHIASRSSRLEGLLSAMRAVLAEIPLAIEGTAGLLAPGHVEVTIRPDDPMQVCDGAVVLRHAIAAVASRQGTGVTFMACPDGTFGSSGHVNVSLRGVRGGGLADRYGEGGLSEVGRAFIAGVLEHAAEVFLLYAPNLNSYRRLGSDPFSPSRLAWGHDNRTCAVRVSGSEQSLRVENRIPGSDANPYLSAAATLASGLEGIARQLRAPAPVAGDAHTSDAPRLPSTLDEALELWEGSDWVARTFGPEVRDHYAAAARAELAEAGVDIGIEAECERYRDAG